MTTETEYAYVGRESCGCVTLLIVDDPAHKREVAKETGAVLRRGGTIERLTVEDARAATPFGCEHQRRSRHD